MSLLLSCRRVFIQKLCIVRSACTRVPESEPPQAKASAISEKTIKHLERLSLVDFANKRGIARLEEAINFADKLEAVDTTGVEPLVSVLENEVLRLRQDKITEENDVKLVLSTASTTEEDYYIAPPGNIPLHSRDLKELMQG